jgi:lycopene cyclase domain-containing protein
MYFFALIPFIVVNGFLTGSFTEDPVVYYNDLENLSIRVLNIPIEDFVYNFNILLLVVAVYEYQLTKMLSVKKN